MADIFLSYASKDKERVRPFAERLDRQGHCVFWPAMFPGPDSRLGILSLVPKSSDAIVVWTKASASSELVRTVAADAAGHVTGES